MKPYTRKNRGNPVVELIQSAVALGNITATMREANIVDCMSSGIAMGCLYLRLATLGSVKIREVQSLSADEAHC